MARKFYYDTGEKKVGPVTGAELLRLLHEGELDAETWVRREGATTWRRLGAIDLRKEEEEERNPGLWRTLRALLPLRALIIVLLVLTLVIVLMVTVVSYAWPILLAVLVFWIISKAMK